MTDDTFLFERRKLRNSVLLCTWLDRSFQTATKILGDFLKWQYFGQEAKVHHLISFPDLAGGRSRRRDYASLLSWFIRICQKLCCSYQYYYTWINMFKKTQTTDVLAAGSVFTSSKCFNTQFVWFYFARSLRTLSRFGGKDFHWRIFSRLHEPAVIGCVTGLFWVILLCFLLFTAQLSSQFIRVCQLKWFL